MMMYAYSNVTACYYTEKQCQNGGRMLGVGCTNERQCAPYHSGPTACVNGCCCTVPNEVKRPPPTLEFGFIFHHRKDPLVGYCYDGQLSQVRCSAQGQCSSGQNCMNGLCCSRTPYEYRYACGGLSALGICKEGQCGKGVYCTASNFCCECPVGRSGGKCNQGVCPNGFICMPNGYCCASCPNDATPFGACREGVCGGGTSCMAGNICC
ncbi:unnamed protein product [Toxocara canis]|uniref:CC domain-containing protein n=1 Tax=Toxocara canis TaxID=6265 RepID=A0A183UAV2_TOXCA|nr:unnamed protein product [Toxocara canis]